MDAKLAGLQRSVLATKTWMMPQGISMPALHSVFCSLVLLLPGWVTCWCVQCVTPMNIVVGASQRNAAAAMYMARIMCTVCGMGCVQ
jgi:hypothetical protein